MKLELILLHVSHKIVVFVIDTICVMSSNVATCFDKLYDHPQATRAHKKKITIATFILTQNGFSVREKCI